MLHLTTKQASAPIGQASAEQVSPLASALRGRGRIEPQHALHVTDYLCWKALADLRAIGACNYKTRKLTDDEFDHNQFSAENGDGEVY